MMENATLTYTHFFTPIFHTQTWQHLHHTFYYFIFTKDALTLTEERKKKMLKKRRKQEGIAGALDGWRRECQTRAQAWGRVSGEKDGLGKAGSNGENGRLLRRARAWVCGWVSTERGGLGKAGSNGESGRFPVCRTLGFQ